jgi:hypothetical protein
MKTIEASLPAGASRLAGAALLLLAAALPSAVLLLAPGCEVESASDPLISVSPQSVSLYEGQSREFVASGGGNYRWTLDKEGHGILSARAGERVVYTSTYDGGSTNEGPVAVILTVSGTVGGTTGTASNTATWSAEAFITHLVDEDE